MSDTPSVEAAWRSHRPYLVNLAYQMLGDVGEAEDVAQEAFLRLSRTDVAEIDDIRGWLTVVAGRLCLDQLRSARARHEQPEDVESVDVVRSAGPDPADRVTLDDEVREAMLEVLRRLSPGERVAFVLHDVFGCRSKRSPRRSAGPWAPVVNSRGAPGGNSPVLHPGSPTSPTPSTSSSPKSSSPHAPTVISRR